jgi:protein involved in polysaccharide export with SLBB domain
MTERHSIRYVFLIVIFFLVYTPLALSEDTTLSNGTALSDDYVIGDGDGLSIHVWGEGSLSQSAKVE